MSAGDVIAIIAGMILGGVGIGATGFEVCLDPDDASLAAFAHDVRDGVRGVHEQIQEDLIEVAEEARDGGNVSIIGFHGRNVLELTGRDYQGVAQGRIDIAEDSLGAIGVREGLHRLHDARILLPFEAAGRWQDHERALHAGQGDTCKQQVVL